MAIYANIYDGNGQVTWTCSKPTKESRKKIAIIKIKYQPFFGEIK